MTPRSLVAIVAIYLVLAWAATAHGADVEPSHTTLHETLIGHAADDECCIGGLDCQCPPASVIQAAPDNGIPMADDTWSVQYWQARADIVPDNPFHPPRHS